MGDSTTTQEYFDAKYQGASDPWNFATDPYEGLRYRHLLRHVPPAKFGCAYEPGCSIGVLTEMLASRCGSVVATDISEVAVAHARSRCASLSNVDVSRATLPDEMPDQTFDLIVFSEIGYYFTKSVLERWVDHLSDRVDPGGRLIAVHWIGSSGDHVLTGDDVHGILLDRLDFVHAVHERRTEDRRDGFVLDVWDRQCERDWR